MTNENTSVKTVEETVEKTTQKTTQKILKLTNDNDTVKITTFKKEKVIRSDDNNI